MQDHPSLLHRDFTVAGGLKLSADWTGPINGPLVVLAHGGGLTRRAWRNTVPALGAHAYEAISIDLRGHGESDWSPARDYSLQAYADDIRAVTRKDGHRRDIHLVGASLGGLASLIASTSMPELKSLVLVDVVPAVDRDRARPIDQFIRANLNGFAGLEEAAEAVSKFQGQPYPPESYDNLRQSLRQGADNRLYWHWDPARLKKGHQFDANDLAQLSNAAKQFKAPLLLIRGELSTIIAEAGVEALQQDAPHVQVVRVTGAGHNVPQGNFEGFIHALLTFLERVRTSAQPPPPQ